MSVRMMQRFLILTLLGAGAALLAADLLFNRDRAAKPDAVHALDAYTIIRAANPVPRGSIIQPKDLVAQPSAVAPDAGAVTRLADASGRVATQDIARAEPLSNTNTAIAPAVSGLAQLIPLGMRAVAVRVTDELAVANLIQPGDHVDVLVISNGVRAARGEEMPFPNAEVRTILQNIRVLAVGDTIVGTSPSGKDYRNVTLAVSPKDAGLIALARTVGTQYLSLRASDDESRTNDSSAVTTEDMRSGAMEARDDADPEADSAAHSIEIITGAGNQRQTAMVPRAGKP